MSAIGKAAPSIINAFNSRGVTIHFYEGQINIAPLNCVLRCANSSPSPFEKVEGKSIDHYLTSAQVTETSDQLGLVQTVGSHLHTSHGDHALVHMNELILGDFNIQRGGIAVVGLKGTLVEVDRDVAGHGRGGKRTDSLWAN